MSKFIIVDDSPFIHKQLKTFLEKHGHVVLGVASDGEEGVSLYKECRPEIMTLDITMPNKNGRDCLKEIIDFDPNVKCIIVSAVQDEEMIVECLGLGAMSFIHKPLKFRDENYCSEFLNSISEALEDE
ncbi:MAG: response regulator [Planctomycetes bacterium]|nr:response regulator [Planctomycetota bacterium]